MNDNDLIRNIIAVAKAGLALQNVVVGIKQGFQPTQQGAPSAPYILLRKLGDKRYGHTYRANLYDTAADVMNHTESAWFETTFQADAICTIDPGDTTALTANDYLKALTRTLQSDDTIATLNAAGIGIYRIQAFTTTYWTDDKGQHEQNPMFTFTVTHYDTVAGVVPSTADIVPNLQPVI